MRGASHGLVGDGLALFVYEDGNHNQYRTYVDDGVGWSEHGEHNEWGGAVSNIRCPIAHLEGTTMLCDFGGVGHVEVRHWTTHGWSTPEVLAPPMGTDCLLGPAGKTCVPHGNVSLNDVTVTAYERVESNPLGWDRLRLL